MDLCRQLTASQPDVFNADFASSLNNFSARLSHLGHHEDALEVIREAVDLFGNLQQAVLASLTQVLYHHSTASLPV